MKPFLKGGEEWDSQEMHHQADLVNQIHPCDPYTGGLVSDKGTYLERYEEVRCFETKNF